MESSEGEWALGPLVMVELNDVRVPLFGKAPDDILRWAESIILSFSWSRLLFGSCLSWFFLQW